MHYFCLKNAASFCPPLEEIFRAKQIENPYSTSPDCGSYYLAQNPPQVSEKDLIPKSIKAANAFLLARFYNYLEGLSSRNNDILCKNNVILRLDSWGRTRHSVWDVTGVLKPVT